MPTHQFTAWARENDPSPRGGCFAIVWMVVIAFLTALGLGCWYWEVLTKP